MIPRPASVGGARWRALALTVDPAAPPVSGAELRNWQNAVALARMGSVTLASLRPRSGPATALDGRIDIVALAEAGERRTAALARRRTTIDVRISKSALGRLLTLAQELRPDVILVEGIPLFPLLKHLRPLTPMLVLDMHNIESDLSAQIHCRNGWRGWLAARCGDAARLRRLERRALAMVDRVWVCSSADRQRLRLGMGDQVPVHVVPNGIPRMENVPLTFPPQPARADGWPVILFVGHLGHPPNITAVTRLADGVLPLVQQRFPAARLLIAGRFPPAPLRSLATRPGVELIANPSRLAPLLARAHLTVVPLSAGGGTRLKILEAMAWGLPVVATPLAAEGLGFVDGVEILIAETDSGLADHVSRLCFDPERFQLQRHHARRAVTQQFGPAAIEMAVRTGIGPGT